MCVFCVGVFLLVNRDLVVTAKLLLTIAIVLPDHGNYPASLTRALEPPPSGRLSRGDDVELLVLVPLLLGEMLEQQQQPLRSVRCTL